MPYESGVGDRMTYCTTATHLPILCISASCRPTRRKSSLTSPSRWTLVFPNSASLPVEHAELKARDSSKHAVVQPFDTFHLNGLGEQGTVSRKELVAGKTGLVPRRYSPLNHCSSSAAKP